MYIIFVLFMIYMIFRTWLQVRRNGETNKIMRIMDHFQDEDQFFTLADEIISTNPQPEFQNKARVLRIFGDANYRRHEDFIKDLGDLDLQALYMKKNQVNLEYNEDSFFYLFAAIANKLYSIGDTEMIAPLYEKLDQHTALDRLLISKIGHEAKKFYLKEDDYGKKFFEDMLEGEYAGYVYNKQLIGIYKSIVTSLLARMALDEGDEAKYKEYEPELQAFTASGLGKRWLRELNIEFPEETEETAEPEETETPEETEETAEETAGTACPG
ncbi:MAG: hypothetical protein IJJ29_09300, partial [Solobacterium sp.]|nr:hypothetical protein [Solobacterium sp.]